MITLTREEAQEVLTALEHEVERSEVVPAKTLDAVAILFAKLAQPEPEPVAWQGVYDNTDLYYRKPPQADVRPLYTAPPQREWQGMEEHEIEYMFIVNPCCDDLGVYEHIAKEIEFKLKERNA